MTPLRRHWQRVMLMQALTDRSGSLGPPVPGPPLFHRTHRWTIQHGFARPELRV